MEKMEYVKNIIMVLLLLFGLALLAEEPVAEQSKPNKCKLLYFGAEWCAPCQQMKKMFKDKEVAKELKRFDFKIYDEKKHPEIFKKYKIRLYPTYIFERGDTSDRYVGGVTKKQFLATLKKY